MHENLQNLLAAARSAGVTAVFVPHHRHVPGEFDGWKFLTSTHEGIKRLPAFLAGSWGADFCPELSPKRGEIIVHEHWLHDGFANTDLAFQLQRRARGSGRHGAPSARADR